MNSEFKKASVSNLNMTSKKKCNFKEFDMLLTLLLNESSFQSNKSQEQALIPTASFDLGAKKMHFLKVMENITATRRKFFENCSEVYNEIENMSENIVQSVRSREVNLKKELTTFALNKFSRWDYQLQHCRQILCALTETGNFVFNDDLYKEIEYLDAGEVKFNTDCLQVVRSINEVGKITYLREYTQNDCNAQSSKKIIPTFMFGGSGKEPGSFCRPWGVCSDPTGRILVCDRSNHRIQIFNEFGEFVFQLGEKEGSNPGQFNRPSGVEVDSSLRIIVADKDNHRIQIFTYAGRFLFEFGTEGTRPGEFKFPWDVSVNKACEIAVSDSKNHRIQLFSQHGKFITLLDGQNLAFINPKSRLKYLDSPRGLAFRSDGSLLATDFNNHRVLLIDKSFSKIAKRFGREGSGKGEFFRPQGIACDQYGNFAVADSKNYRVQIFRADGNFLKSFGIKGCSPGEFDCPQGLCFLPNKNLVVVDFSNNRVQVF